MIRSTPASLRVQTLLTPLVAALAVAACGGSSDAPTTTVSGSIVKGPVQGSQVCAYVATSSGKGAQLGCTTTAANGTYSLQIAASGDVVIEATGGTYTDEATNATTSLAQPMQVVVAAGSSSQVTGVVTPITSMAYSLSRNASGGVNAASFGTSLGQLATSFNLSGTNLAASVPDVSTSPDAYGRMLRAVSEYLRTGGTLSSLLAVESPTALQTALQNAYATINGSTITINLAGLGGTAGTGGTTGGGTTGGGGTNPTGAAGTLTIGFSAGGIGGASIPNVVINGVSAPPAGTFCSGLSANDANLAALRSVGTLTINNCSGSGNSYTVNMTVAAGGITIPYTVTYTYS